MNELSTYEHQLEDHIECCAACTARVVRIEQKVDALSAAFAQVSGFVAEVGHTLETEGLSGVFAAMMGAPRG